MPNENSAAEASVMSKIGAADKLQLYHRFFQYLRGGAWKGLYSLILRDFSCGRGTKCTGMAKFTHRNGSVKIGNGCIIGRGVFKSVSNAHVSIGDRVLLNHGFVIAAEQSISIGDDCLVGENVSIRDANHAFDDLEIPIAEQGSVTDPIKIGDNVWIGRGTAILLGVEIGSGAIIGANSVVTKSVAANTIVAGCPAKVIRRRDQ